MNYIDIAIGGFILFGSIKGLFKGFIIEVAGLIALILGIAGALLFSPIAEEFITSVFSLESVPPAGVVFAIVFIGIIIAINLLARMLTKIIKMAALSTINRLFGALFGGLKFALIMSAVLLLVDQFSFLFAYFDVQVIEDSYLYAPIKTLGSDVFSWLLDKKELFPQNLV